MFFKNQKKMLLWKDAVCSAFHPRVVTMFFFGISAGIPLLLIFSSLSLWLREAGIDRSAVTFFSWAALGYSFKFVWAPIVDVIPVLFLKKLGRRRSWIILSQIMIILSVCGIASIDPSAGANHVYACAFFAVCLGFSAATQDIVIDAYRIESAGVELQAMMASSYIAGYRIGMLISGAGALFAAEFLGSKMGAYNYIAWKYTYFLMAAFMLTGIITVLCIKEPDLSNENSLKYSNKDYLKMLFAFLCFVIVFASFFYFTSGFSIQMKGSLEKYFLNDYLAGFIVEFVRLVLGFSSGFLVVYVFLVSGFLNQKMVDDTYIYPIKDFFDRYGLKLALILLSLIGLYRISDIVLGIISNLFYQDLGFSKKEIAAVVKTFGLFMTIAGGFLGGILSQRFGVLKILFAGAVLSSATNLLFMAMAYSGHNMYMLYAVISADNLAAGIASAAFVAFLSSLTNIKFTAVQYAVFSSIMTLIPKIFGGYSGTIVDGLGYKFFFMFTAVIGLPVLIIILLAAHYLEIKD